MEGSPDKINEGLKIAIDSGDTMLEELMEEDDSTLQKPEHARFQDWLLMTILVLACDDKKAMINLETLFLEHCGIRDEQNCMSESDALRIFLPLTILNGNPDRANLEGFIVELKKNRDFNLGKLDHWQDPFLHARRIATKRLACKDSLDSFETVSSDTNCSCLARWLELKGWKSVEK